MTPPLPQTVSELSPDEVLGHSIEWQTCIGSSGPYPRDRGNCFSLSGFKIVNFKLENLKELINLGLKLPVKLKILSEATPRKEGIAVIHDERIHPSWFRNNFCEICCPFEFLPLPQKLAKERAERNGSQTSFGEGLYLGIKYDGNITAQLVGAPDMKDIEAAISGYKFQEMPPRMFLQVPEKKE